MFKAHNKDVNGSNVQRIEFDYIDEVEPLPDDWAKTLRHMLGVGDHIAKRSWGYRNRFCAAVGGDDQKKLQAMQRAGLVVSGARINEGRNVFYWATKFGCEAIGLTQTVIKRVFED